MGCAPSAPATTAAQPRPPAGRYVYGGPVDAAPALAPPPPGGPTPDQVQFIAEALKGTALLGRAPRARALVAARATRSAPAAGALIYAEGAASDAVYVVEDGAVAVGTSQKTRAHCFGEEALLGPARHREAATSKECVVWRVDAKEARRCVAVCAHAKDHRHITALARVGLLEGLTGAQLQLTAAACEETQYEAGAIIVKKGATGDTMYCVLEGSVDCAEIGTGPVSLRDLHLKAGEYFGERSLVCDQFRAATVTARTGTVLLELARPRFISALGAPLRQVLDANLRLNVLASVEVLDQLTPDERVRCAALFVEKVFEAGEIVVRQGEMGDAFYVVKSGRCRVEVGAERRVVGALEPGNYFGERALLGADVRTASVVAEDRVECALLSRRAFEGALGPLARIRARGAAAATPRWPCEALELGAVLKGAFGAATVVKAPDGRAYLLRAPVPWLRRAAPWPAPLGIYGDGSRLVARAPGGPLRARGPLSDGQVLFYAAGVRDALAQVHALGVVVRALSPDDIHVDQDGRPVLAEFAAAKTLAEGARTYTLVGFAHYLSPEQVLGSGHDTSSDLWALGCLVHELATGSVPFASLVETIAGAYAPPPTASGRAAAALLAVDAAARGGALTGLDAGAAPPWTPPPGHVAEGRPDAARWDAW